MDLWSLLSPDWQKALNDQQATLEQIDQKLNQSQGFNPAKERVFAALGKSPKNFRVILIGQDPYPNPDYAMGIACSVPKTVTKLPPSLKNIQKEFFAEFGRELNQDLTPWTKSGVLLLNRILTCESWKTLSHRNFGWQAVTEAIVKSVVEVNPEAIGLLWGNKAAEMEPLFGPGLVVKSVHPSPLSANPRDGKPGFFGSKPFSKVNELLSQTKQPPINW